jgi:hypothetical protein
VLKLSFALCPLLAFSVMAQEKSASNEAPASAATESSAATSAQIEEARAKAEAARAKLPLLQLQAQAALKKYTEGSAGLCSIPLLEVPISPGTNFTLKQLTPNLKSLAPMPLGKGPAPPCASTPR